MSYRGDNPMRGHSTLDESGAPNVFYQAERWAEVAALAREVQKLHLEVQRLNKIIQELRSV